MGAYNGELAAPVLMLSEFERPSMTGATRFLKPLLITGLAAMLTSAFSLVYVVMLVMFDDLWVAVWYAI